MVMIDEAKYLSWFREDDPNFEAEVVWREMYSNLMSFLLIFIFAYSLSSIGNSLICFRFG